MALTWPPPADLELQSDAVTLRRYVSSDAPELADSLQDSRIWEHLPVELDGPRDWDAYAAKGAATGRWPFVVRLAKPHDELPVAAAVGCSSFYDVSIDNSHLSIGYTTYRPEVWGTNVNPATKLLLLGYAFDTLGAERVQFKTDNANLRSQAALRKIGATQEGVLRQHMLRRDGTYRDSVVFSILRSEWSAVRGRLGG